MQADGGDVVFMAGNPTFRNGEPMGKFGNIIFKLPDNTEFLKITGTGEVYVKGELGSYDLDVYDAFKSWIQIATLSLQSSANLDEGKPKSQSALLKHTLQVLRKYSRLSLHFGATDDQITDAIKLSQTEQMLDK